MADDARVSDLPADAAGGSEEKREKKKSKKDGKTGSARGVETMFRTILVALPPLRRVEPASSSGPRSSTTRRRASKLDPAFAVRSAVIEPAVVAALSADAT